MKTKPLKTKKDFSPLLYSRLWLKALGITLIHRAAMMRMYYAAGGSNDNRQILK